MRLVVSGEYPYAVVMKGGGVKGLAFASALHEIAEYFWFDRHVGTSAGAIAAVLLAAGYSPNDLVRVLSEKKFRDFHGRPALEGSNQFHISARLLPWGQPSSVDRGSAALEDI
jgi:predicted acylesterase/phospholipase RssA